ALSLRQHIPTHPPDEPRQLRQSELNGDGEISPVTVTEEQVRGRSKHEKRCKGGASPIKDAAEAVDHRKSPSSQICLIKGPTQTPRLWLSSQHLRPLPDASNPAHGDFGLLLSRKQTSVGAKLTAALCQNQTSAWIPHAAEQFAARPFERLC